MKNIFPLVIILSFILAISCNENDKGSGAAARTRTDSLLNDVMDGHDFGMAKMGKLTRAEQTTRRLLDSLAKLPAKAREAAEPLKVKLDSLQKELSYAEFAMNKWMDEFNADSAVDNPKDRINYLEDEKLKIAKVKEAILGSLEKADSLIRGKF